MNKLIIFMSGLLIAATGLQASVKDTAAVQGVTVAESSNMRELVSQLKQLERTNPYKAMGPATLVSMYAEEIEPTEDQKKWDNNYRQVATKINDMIRQNPSLNEYYQDYLRTEK